MRSSRWQLAARTRLTLWYVLLLVGMLLGFGALGLWQVGRTLYADADRVLRTKSAAVQTEIDVTKGRVSFDAESAGSSQMPAVASGLDIVRIWDKDGRVVYQRELLPGLPPVDRPSAEAIAAEEQRYDTVRAEDGTSVRLYFEPVREKGRLVGAVQVGRSEVELEAVLGQLRVAGVIGLALALLLAWAGGSFLARRALAPVDRITRAAERIGAEDLSRRLAFQLPNDELGRLASAFNGMIERLDEAFQRQRRFTADASHELRTPLAIIRSQAEAARERPRDAAYDTRVFDSIYEESERLSHLVESLLILARADSGQPLALAVLDLEELIAEVGARVAPRVAERGIELAVQVGETATIRGDAAWLAQVLRDLLDNALRHTPPGGRVTLSAEPAPGGVFLKVADTGEGIAPEHLPRIVERFYRVDRARNRASGGSGLGLAICDWVTRAHGGRLEIASQVGRGTTVSLWLPAATELTVEASPSRPAGSRETLGKLP